MLGFFTWAQMAAYVVSVFDFYRAALFIHEIDWLPEPKPHVPDNGEILHAVFAEVSDFMNE